MSEKPEFIFVESITGTTLLEDGGISFDIRDRDGNERVLEFKPEMQANFFRCLLPRPSAIGTGPRIFPAEAAELLESQSGNFAILFRLSGDLSIAIGLSAAQLLNLRDLLNGLEEQTLQ